jgi:hypothetical protein
MRSKRRTMLGQACISIANNSLGISIKQQNW